MASEYDTLTSERSIELFSKWKVDQFKGFLKRRGVILSERKAKLAEKAYYAWKLKLEVAKTTQNEEDDISTRRREKLTIESGVSLPFPSSLKKGWETGNFNFPGTEMVGANLRRPEVFPVDELWPFIVQFGIWASIKVYFSIFSLIHVPMENKHVVLKQFIIKVKLTEQPKTIAGVLTFPDFFDRCHIRTRHNGLFFLCLDKKCWTNIYDTVKWKLASRDL